MTRGKKYDYLSVILDYHSEEKLKVDIAYYADNMVEEFLEKLNSKGKALYNDSLFKISTKSPALETEKAELLHSFIIKCIFLVNRARLNLKPSFAFLSA